MHIQDELPDLQLQVHTRGVSEEEYAAVYAALAVLKTEESLRVRAVARRAREPWRRSQRTPQGIAEFLD